MKEWIPKPEPAPAPAGIFCPDCGKEFVHLEPAWTLQAKQVCYTCAEKYQSDSQEEWGYWDFIGLVLPGTEAN